MPANREPPEPKSDSGLGAKKACSSHQCLRNIAGRTRRSARVDFGRCKGGARGATRPTSIIFVAAEVRGAPSILHFERLLTSAGTSHLIGLCPDAIGMVGGCR